jgi:transcription-repair coupling factor (superfamily II helicase)
MVLAPEVPILPLAPADDEQTLLTGERIAQVRAILDARAPCLIVTSIHALLQPIPDPAKLAASTLTLQVGADLPFDALPERLCEIGYRREELVAEPLTFAIHGGILDLWAAGNESPVRIEFFGDEIESIRRFDPITQCSISREKSIALPPTPDAKLATVQLLPLLTDCAVCVHDEPSVEAILEQLRPLSTRRSNLAFFNQTLAKFKAPVCRAGEPLFAEVPAVALAALPINGVRDIAGKGGTHHPDFYARIRKEMLLDLDGRARKKEKVFIGVDTAAAHELLAHELPPDSPIAIFNAALSEGFSLKNLNLTVISQRDLYPTQRTWRQVRKIKSPVSGQRLEYSFDVEPGELVVHLSHGIGRFTGLTEIDLNGQRTEVFTLEYAEGAKLHVPTTHAHLLSRYIGPDAKKIRLHSLDGKRWSREKEAAQKGIEDLAAGLLETQARRRIIPGFAFDLSDPWLVEFEAMFPWQETPDQTRVIAEIKADMAAPVAMDRLLCGDAGYGKTEVAMRAAFIAVTNHKQVALLAPTTVLAEQHYATFCDRMAHFPIRIEALSRFRSPAQRRKVREAAERGEVDILIGTHALLAENVNFKDLGLLVIDEEQRFGVVHKERLKRIRALVDVLTMSATPIPRTLYLSLTGARDLSLIQTPPLNRVAVETIIQRDTDELLIAAIRKELARGGQVFYLYNRVHTIGHIYARLQRLLPETRILVGHGQMPAKELAETMQRFEQGQADILLCTTIIESGIDIPRANTILIDRADRFGLADLYQLRGRVGRSATKGFAYLLLPAEGYVDSDSRKRLQALRRHSGLGSGYAIAMRDLEIRGSGNLLGAAQSGHIAAIGFGLYCQLLRRTVARMKGEHIPDLVEVEISLDFLDASPGSEGDNAAAIPYDYVEDDAQRMNVYRRLAEAISEKELTLLKRELTDRYGPLPDAAKRTFKLASLRILAAEKALAKIEVTRDHLFCYVRRNHAPLRHYTNLPLPEETPDRRLKRLSTILTSI